MLYKIESILSYSLLILFFSGVSPAAEAKEDIGGNTCLVWDQKKKDFGSISRSETLSHRFVCVNTCGETIIFAPVKSPCGCTAALIHGDTLAPGDTGIVTLELVSRKIQGAFTHTLTLQTNKGSIELLLTGTVQRNISLNPPQLKLNKVFVNDTVSATVVIQWERSTPPRFGDLTWGQHIAAATVEPVADAYALTVLVAPRINSGTFTDTIAMATGCADWPFLYIPVEGRVAGVIAASPTYIDFGSISGGTQNTATISLFSKRKYTYTITDIRTEPAFINVSIGPRVSGRHILKAVIFPESPKGPFHGKTEIYIHNEKTPQLTIPLSGNIQ